MASGVVGDPLTYYMGTTGGGVWKTEDAGVQWDNISDGYFKTGSVGAVAVSESDPNIVYVGMGEHAPRGVMSSYGDGVYKSYDAGKTWKHMGLEKTMQISRIVIHPKNPDIVFVAAQGAIHGATTDRGIYKSIDGGATWKKTLYINDLTGCSELSMDMHNPRVLYAAMWHYLRLPWKVISGGPGSALYKSTDGGETWNKMEKGLPKEMGKMAIAVSRANPEKVYALIESDYEKDLGGLYASHDAGKSWSKVSGDHQLIQRSWYYIEVFPDPQDEHTVYVMSAPALRSIDGGKHGKQFLVRMVTTMIYGLIQIIQRIWSSRMMVELELLSIGVKHGLHKPTCPQHSFTGSVWTTIIHTGFMEASRITPQCVLKAWR